MDAQAWQVLFTGLIAAATLIYTLGTLLLWRITLNALRLNLILAMREVYGLRAAQMTTLLRAALPRRWVRALDAIGRSGLTSA